MLLRSALLSSGEITDVRIVDGMIAQIGNGLASMVDEQILDLDRRLLLCAFTEPHAHLDKAFLSERITNPSGDLLGAIRAMEAHRPQITIADTIERAERAARLLVANGATLIRTHADTTVQNGLSSIEALVEVRRRLAAVCDLQIVALVSWPVTGIAGVESRALLRDALQAGADVVGGCPHLDVDPSAANETLLGIAAEFGRDVDLHTDETLDPTILALADLAERVSASGFPHRVTASHCVSLGMQTPARQQQVAEQVAAAGISVVALPQTNLYLQGREQQQAMPRAITAVRALRLAGVNVCAGADNLQDPFNPMGRGDPLETGALMVMASHLLADEALDMVTGAARRAVTGRANQLAAGEPADLVAVRATSTREALAFGPPDRVVIRGGQLVTASFAADHRSPHSETYC